MPLSGYQGEHEQAFTVHSLELHTFVLYRFGKRIFPYLVISPTSLCTVFEILNFRETIRRIIELMKMAVVRVAEPITSVHIFLD